VEAPTAAPRRVCWSIASHRARCGLIVEVDGGYHARRVTADARRDRKLTRAGYRVVRLQAELVMRDLPAAVRAVRRALDER